MVTENVVRFDDWDELLLALDEIYTISFKDVCRIFKASRSWVNLHVRPFVRCVYLSNYGKVSKLGNNWVKVASLALGKDFNEKIWFNKADFIDFLQNCVHSVTRQTKCISVESLMEENNIKLYEYDLERLAKEWERTHDILKRYNIKKEMQTIHEKYMKTDENTNFLYENRITDFAKRSDTERICVDLNVSEIYEKWVAPHELKGYGDTDELVYRNFFKNGLIRIELHVPDINGEIGKKIFYCQDNSDLSLHGEIITVSQKIYQEYQEKIGNV